MTLGIAHHEGNAYRSFTEARELLNDALNELDLCEYAHVVLGNPDWVKVARLADNAFIASINPATRQGGNPRIWVCRVRVREAGFEVNFPRVSEWNPFTVTPHP